MPNYLEQSQTEAENKQVTAIPKQLKDEEYFSFYSSNLDNIKLTKMFDVAPLYGDYAEALNNVLLDMETKDSLFHIFKNIKLKTLHDQRRKIDRKSVV